MDLQAYICKNHVLSLFNILFYPNSSLIFKPNRETRHSVTIVLIPNLRTFSTISLIIITHPKCIVHRQCRPVPSQFQIRYTCS